MRINVYSQEIRTPPEIVTKSGHTGVRLWFGSETLDHTDSAITFWLPNGLAYGPKDLASMLRQAAALVDPPGVCPIRKILNPAPVGMEHS